MGAIVVEAAGTKGIVEIVRAEEVGDIEAVAIIVVVEVVVVARIQGPLSAKRSIGIW